MMLHRHLLVVVQVLTGAAIVRAQSATAAAGGSSELSTAAAVGIAVAVSVAACFGIAAIIICLIVRHYRRKPRRKPAETGWIFEGPHGRNKAKESQQIVTYIEEGSGIPTESAAIGMQQSSRHSVDESREVHTIPVKVTSPDDLRFKICRKDGHILVATDPAHSSLCSREGVRSGDRILGVHVDIAGAPGAHPKEISELLSLSSDYLLTVDFQHRGPVLRGPPVAPAGGSGGGRQPRPVSAAEKALRRQHRGDGVEAVDGGPPRARHYSAARRRSDRRTRKSRAPLPPTPPTTPPPLTPDNTSAFAIHDRRKRVEDEENQDQAPDRQPGEEAPSATAEDEFDRLCETLAHAAADEGEWRPLDVRLVTLADVDSDSDDSESSSRSSGSEKFAAVSGEIPEEAAEVEEEVELAAASTRLASSSIQRLPPSPLTLLPLLLPRVERIYDHYELEEQDVVPAMPPPSADRPVVDCCTQFDCAAAAATHVAEVEREAAASVLLATPVWECLPNRPQMPQPARPVSWVSLPNCPIAPIAETDEPDSERAESLLAELLMPVDELPWTDTTLERDLPSEGDFQESNCPTFEDETLWGLAGADPEELLKPVDDAPPNGVTAGEVSSTVGDIMEGYNYVEEQSLSALVKFEELEGDEDLTADNHGEWDPEDDDRELTNYLSVAAEKMQQQPQRPDPLGGDSTASSSALTVQEEAVEEVLVINKHAGIHGPKREDSLVELTRSMALRDVEVATVILLDSEARQRRELEDAVSLTASSSGRSTVYEDAIDPTMAPDKRRPMGSAEADANEAEDAAALNADFDLAAAEWAARAAPPPTPPPSPPPPPPLHSLDLDDEDFTASDERDQDFAAPGETEQDFAAPDETDQDFAAPDARRDLQDSPLLDPSLISEIVQSARNIWTVEGDRLEDGEEDQFVEQLDDSQLSGENLSELLRQLEDNEEY